MKLGATYAFFLLLLGLTVQVAEKLGVHSIISKRKNLRFGSYKYHEPVLNSLPNPLNIQRHVANPGGGALVSHRRHRV